ncbi:MAG: hypothetical protein WCW40_09380 [Bacteroidota bacterium]
MRITAAGILLIGILVAGIFEPSVLYQNSTIIGRHTIYHSRPLDAAFVLRFHEAEELITASQFYDSTVSIRLCLNDGSVYPKLNRFIRGEAFAWGFANTVVLSGTADFQNNFVTLNDRRWNAVELIAHEMMHCVQFGKLGIMKSNPVANYPEWKWEGYPEYISRKERTEGLITDINRLISVEKTVHNDWIQFEDSTGTVIPYYRAWLLLQYCMDVKKMHYPELLVDTTSEATLYQEMLQWQADHVVDTTFQ